MALHARIERFMSPHPLVLRSDRTASAARRLLLENGFTSLPIVDAAGRLCGVVSATDLLRGDSERADDQRGLNEVMTSSVVTEDLHASVAQAASVMAANHLHHLVVVDGRHRPVGVISATDVVRAVAESGLDTPVARIMSTELVIVDAGATVAEVRQTLAEAGVTAAVVSGDAEFVGIVDQLALLGADGAERVEARMETAIRCVPEAATISSVARELAEGRARRVLVLDADAALLGIVTLSDFVSYAAGLSEYDGNGDEDEEEEIAPD